MAEVAEKSASEVVEASRWSKDEERERKRREKKKMKLLKEESGVTKRGMAEVTEKSASEVVEASRLSKDEDRERKRREKKKMKLLKEVEKAKKRGVCYLSRIPPKMDPLKLRQILSAYGEVQRIYLAPEDPEAQMRRKRSGGFRGQGFSEGWVEFADKRVALRVANMLNGEQIGGKKRSQFYFDIWNIKYLSKFKWDDLTEEIAYRNAVREQKLQMELSLAKKERDFYLSKVEQSRALSEIEERLKKKRKVGNGTETDTDHPVEQQKPKVIRQFSQKQPLAEEVAIAKPKLSNDVLAKVFNANNR